MPDPASEAEAQAELSFESGDYAAVARLLTGLRDGNDDAKLWLAIAECRLGRADRALPLLKYWRDMDYCGTGKIPRADLPVEATPTPGPDAVEATAWLILSLHRASRGRPALAGYLAAQRLAPRNPAIAGRLVEAGIVGGDLALARRNLPLVAASRKRAVREGMAGVAAQIDRREAEAEARARRAIATPGKPR